MFGDLKKWGVIGVAGMILLALNWFQFKAGQRTREELGQVKAALSLSVAALEEMKALRNNEALLVVDSAKRQEELAAANRGLENKLRKAMRDAKEKIDLETVLPDGVADALCLRWHAAGGNARASQANAAAGADAGTGDTAAARRGVTRPPRKAASGLARPERDGSEPGTTLPGEATSAMARVAQDVGPSDICRNWRGKLTLGDTVEWAGLLLDHAGLERLDKEAIREWATQSGR